jgi:opacity protein-like surface antigen
MKNQRSLMKIFYCLITVLALISFANADDAQPKHIISIGTEGFGWSGMSMVFDWDNDKSGIKENVRSEGNLKLNYHYVFSNRFMLGGELNSETSRTTTRTVAGDKNRNEESNAEIALSFGYNFNEDLRRSWWAKFLLGSGKTNEVTKDSTGKTERDYGYTLWGLSFGKRISLESWGLANVSYNPSMTLKSARVNGDAKDEGLDAATQVTLEILKIDILF